MKKLNWLLLFAIVLGCSKAGDLDFSSGAGQGGSMARFAAGNGYLYLLAGSKLLTYEIQPDGSLQRVAENGSNAGPETLFLKDTVLLIGTQQGMEIYSVSNPVRPVRLSTYPHIRSCDPVVANDSVAYVSLREGTECRDGENRLDVVDISNLRDPTLLQSYSMENPHGLGLDSHLLFVCEGDSGIKTFGIIQGAELINIQEINGFDAYDVIPFNNVLIVTGWDGIHQFRYDVSGIQEKLSTIPVTASPDA